MKMRTPFHFLRTQKRATKDTKTSSWVRSLSSKIPGSCITRRSTQYWSYFPRRSWTDMTWSPKAYNHQYSTWASTQPTPSSLTSSMRSLTRWHNITSLSSRPSSLRTTKVFVPWSQTTWRFRTPSTDLERSSRTSRSFTELLTRSYTTFRRWQMSSRRGARRACLSMLTRGCSRIPRSRRKVSFKRNWML